MLEKKKLRDIAEDMSGIRPTERSLEGIVNFIEKAGDIHYEKQPKTFLGRLRELGYALNGIRPTQRSLRGIINNIYSNYEGGGGDTGEVYGVSGLYDESPTLTRTDKAVGMGWVNTNGTITSQLDDVYPFNAIKDVTLDTGDVMVEIPEMWFRVGYDSSKRLTNIAVSNEKGKGKNWYHTQAFQVGKYLTVNDGISKSGYQPGVPQDFVSNIETIKAKGMYYETIYHYTILKFLFYIYFATKDSQSVFNSGGTGSLGATGKTNSNYAKNCIVQNRFKFLGIEDFVGNQLQMLAGSYENYFYDVYNNQEKIMEYEERSVDGKIQLSYNTVNSDNGYNIKALGWDSQHPFICIPIETTSETTYTTYFCEALYSETYRNNRMVINSGHSFATYTWGDSYGIGCFTSSNWNYYAAANGCRLVKFLTESNNEESINNVR